MIIYIIIIICPSICNIPQSQRYVCFACKLSIKLSPSNVENTMNIESLAPRFGPCLDYLLNTSNSTVHQSLRMRMPLTLGLSPLSSLCSFEDW